MSAMQVRSQSVNRSSGGGGGAAAASSQPSAHQQQAAAQCNQGPEQLLAVVQYCERQKNMVACGRRNDGQEPEVITIDDDDDQAEPTDMSSNQATSQALSQAASSTQQPASEKRSPSPDPNRRDESVSCNVCWSAWTTDGPHRLVALKCGHLFGHSCVQLVLRSSRCCPMCKQPAKESHVRLLYATAVRAASTDEVVALQSQLRQGEQSMAWMKQQLTSLQEQVRLLKHRNAELEEVTDAVIGDIL